MVRSLILLLITVGLQAQVVVSAAPRTWIAPEDVQDRVEQFVQGYRTLEAQIPARLYDVDALAEALDYDVEAAAAYVRDEIAYDAYMGVMRGPSGSISTGAGSSWDQAVLLSALINAMAGEAMLVRGDLTPSDAERLLSASLGDRSQMDPGIDRDDVLAAFEGSMSRESLAKIPNEAVLAEATGYDLASRSDAVVAHLVEALETTIDFDARSDAETEALITAIAGDYVWVQYRDTPNDPWQTIHPAFGSLSAPQVEATSYIADTVPDENLHLVQFELEIERREGDCYHSEVIMKPYRRPAANLAARQITLEIAPNKIPDEGEAGFFVPLINGRPAEDAKAFTLRGLTAPAEDAAAGPEIFATAGDRFGGALDQLAEATGGRSDAPVLSGVILKVTHIAPGGEKRTEVRRLVDFREGTPDDATSALLFRSVFDINVGRENGARAVAATSRSLAEQLPRLPYLVALGLGEIAPEEALGHPAFSNLTLEISWPGMALSEGLFDPAPSQAQTITRTGPLIVMLRVEPGKGVEGRPLHYVDILHNPTIALENSGSTFTVDPKDTLRQGVRETIAENLINGPAPERLWLDAPLGETIATRSALADWIDANEPLPALADRMRADLAASGVLILSQSHEDLRWWRLDPLTGQTLGMGLRGGQSTSEYLYTVYTVVDVLSKPLIAAYQFSEAVRGCEQAFPANKQMANCCKVGNVTETFTSAVSGGIIGSHWLSAIGSVTDILAERFEDIPGTRAASEFACGGYFEP